MEQNAANCQLLAAPYESVASAESSHSSFRSMMAFVLTEERLKVAKQTQAHHSAPSIFYHDPYQAALLHAEQPGMPDQPSPYDLMIAAVGGTAHAVTAALVDPNEGGGYEDIHQSMQQQQQEPVVVNKVYAKAEPVIFSGAMNNPASFVNQSNSSERRGSCTSVDMQGSETRRKKLTCSASIADDDIVIKDKIRAHPEYHKLVTAYINFRKVGAPPDVGRRLEELSREYADPQLLGCKGAAAAATDPELDQFIETYCLTLHKYEEELSKPFNEAMAFLQKVELQISHGSRAELRLPLQGQGFDSRLSMEHTQHRLEDHEDEEDEGAFGYGEVDFEMDASMDPQNEDKQLKEQLLRKYKGYISTLKHEFMKKKKKGKLPKDARQQLLDWWTEHSKWPYPTETEKGTLAATTGLDQKQINNWFINQRKRHWKPSEQDVQYVMVDGQDPPMQPHPLVELP